MPAGTRAQVLDRTDRLDEAMILLAEAKQIVRALTDTDLLIQGYDQGAESARRFTYAQPKNILHEWARFFPVRKRGTIPRLTFLGGHPRSGTTLLEQILDAHPDVAALDEPTAFTEVLEPAFHQSKQLSSARINVLRRTYIQALEQELGGNANGKLLVDKNPSPTARLLSGSGCFPNCECSWPCAIRATWCSVVIFKIFHSTP